jgi:hypothetical protein
MGAFGLWGQGGREVGGTRGARGAKIASWRSPAPRLSARSREALPPRAPGLVLLQGNWDYEGEKRESVSKRLHLRASVDVLTHQNGKPREPDPFPGPLGGGEPL